MIFYKKNRNVFFSKETLNVGNPGYSYITITEMKLNLNYTTAHAKTSYRSKREISDHSCHSLAIQMQLCKLPSTR